MEDQSVNKYDRIRGGMQGVALFTKPSTIRSVQPITGRAETFVVETARHEELGDYIFVEMVDESGVVRMALPPRVANAIASQREALTTRRRSIAAKAQAKSRMDRGEVPFLRRKAEPAA
jgi:predicted aspartyl protease